MKKEIEQLSEGRTAMDPLFLIVLIVGIPLIIMWLYEKVISDPINKRHEETRESQIKENREVQENYEKLFAKKNPKLTKEQLSFALKWVPDRPSSGEVLFTEEFLRSTMETKWAEYKADVSRLSTYNTVLVAGLENVQTILSDKKTSSDPEVCAGWFQELFEARGENLENYTGTFSRAAIGVLRDMHDGDWEDVLAISSCIALVEKTDHPDFKNVYVRSKKTRDLIETYYRANLEKYSFSYAKCKRVMNYYVEILNEDVMRGVKKLNF